MIYLLITIFIVLILIYKYMENDHEEVNTWAISTDNSYTDKDKKMTINDFAKKLTKAEGKKKQVSIAQVKEILKIANSLLNGKLYKIIRDAK